MPENELSDFDRALLKEVAGDLPLVPRPFAGAAARLGVTEEQIVERLRALKDAGIIRRWGARVNHYAVGRTHNCMVVWRAPSGQEQALGGKLAGHPAVSHCYLRPALPDFPYTLYTMVHARSAEELARAVSELEALAGTAPLLLHSVKEYKKSTPRYFADTP